MPTAKGTIGRTGPNTFEGKFDVDGVEYMYIATSAIALPYFFSPDC